VGALREKHDGKNVIGSNTFMPRNGRSRINNSPFFKTSLAGCCVTRIPPSTAAKAAGLADGLSPGMVYTRSGYVSSLLRFSRRLPPHKLHERFVLRQPATVRTNFGHSPGISFPTLEWVGLVPAGPVVRFVRTKLREL
jgi:hypothetical protein